MRLYVIRHGKAHPAPSGHSDDLRPLTDRGWRQARWLGRSLAADQPPLLLLHSPILRAVETASAIAESIDCPAAVEPMLATGRRPSDVFEVVRRNASVGVLALVGHNPHFEDFTGLMCQGIGASARLRTGEMAVLECSPAAEPGKARLLELRRLDESD
ncbi:MAG: histidine phosphatase family protein [Phycisphaeraceae bacterium]|nr:histidine phosphatase family protein [Phycisphaeraceae bacterium]